MARNMQNLAALAALLGAGALASRKKSVDLGELGKAEEFQAMDVSDKGFKEAYEGRPMLLRPSNPANITSRKKGGYVTAADGCVKRGKTRGKMV